MSTNQQIRLLCYQSSEKMSVFVFVISNQKDKSQNESKGVMSSFNDTRITKKSYIFVRKTKEEMDIILQSNVDVLKYNDEVYILKSYNRFEKIVFKDIRDFHFPSKLNISSI